MINRKPMKTLLVLSLIILGFKANAQPIAKAGPDRTIYLTQTNSVTLDGSASSGDSYKWTDISTDYKSTDVITSPISPTTTVTGLEQGVWYYQLSVTTGAITKRDTLVVTVDYDVPPAGGTLLNYLQMKNDTIYNFVNNRAHINELPPGTADVHTAENAYILDRGRSNSTMIDKERGKFYSILEDGIRGKMTIVIPELNYLMVQVGH